jgi:RimJ/RimL family protein N-acetyltransferase
VRTDDRIPHPEPTLVLTNLEVEGWFPFVDELVGRVPGIPATASPDFDITRHGMLDHVQRSLVRDTALRLNSSLTPDAVSAARTLGELFEVVGRRGPSGSLVRGTYATERVKLRPIRPGDYPALYEASLDPRSSFRWRFRGATPGPEEFHQQLFGGVTAQYAVVDLDDEVLYGLVTAYQHRPEVGTCFFAFQRCAPEGTGSGGEMVAGAFLFVDYLFTTFRLRKLYVELPEYNRYLVDGLVGSLLRQEGCLEEYFWHDDRYWSMLLLSMQRGAWEDVARATFEDHRRSG